MAGIRNSPKIVNGVNTPLRRRKVQYILLESVYFSVDESGRILEANLRSAALLGVERSRFVNRRFLAFVAPPSQPTFLIFLDKIVAGTADQSCELRLLKEDGGTFWAGFRAAPAVGPAGGRKWCRVAFEDISDRKQVEETLRESEKRYRTLFELFPVAVYSCDAAGVIQEFNRRAAELWGREPVSGETDERFCGSFKLFRPDGSFMPHEQCPMAEFTKRTGIQVRFTTFTSGRIPQLSQSMSIVFYRVAQEALTNVARHARASLAEVNFEKLPDAFCLQIKDHGKSFPATRALHPKQNSRLGILGMRERLEMVGGSFKIESSPGKGTVVQARIPLANCRVGSGGGGGGGD